MISFTLARNVTSLSFNCSFSFLLVIKTCWRLLALIFLFFNFIYFLLNSFIYFILPLKFPFFPPTPHPPPPLSVQKGQAFHRCQQSMASWDNTNIYFYISIHQACMLTSPRFLILKRFVLAVGRLSFITLKSELCRLF